MPELVNSAPKFLKKKVFRTSRLLLGYNVELVLRLPIETFKKVFPDQDAGAKPEVLDWPESAILADLLAVIPFSKYWSANESRTYGELRVKRERNELYPALLGVLAKKI